MADGQFVHVMTLFGRIPDQQISSSSTIVDKDIPSRKTVLNRAEAEYVREIMLGNEAFSDTVDCERYLRRGLNV
jgi:hypothetical protein